MGEYDPGYQPPGWWQDEAKRIIETDWKGRRAELGAQAAKAVGRNAPWDATRITKFIAGDNQTLKMTLGIAAAIGLPPPIIEARTMAEAQGLQQKAKTFDSLRKSNPDLQGKVEAAVQGAEAVAKEKNDQRRPVQSAHERRTGSGGTRRPPGRG